MQAPAYRWRGHAPTTIPSVRAGQARAPRTMQSLFDTVLLAVQRIAALSRRLVIEGLRDGGDQLRSLGAGPLLSALLMLLHERFGVLTVLLTAFGRAVSEVGAVMIVGGNVDGFTRVMTTAIAL